MTLKTLRMKQEGESETSDDERSNFRKLSQNAGSNKTSTSKKRKACEELINALSKSQKESKKEGSALEKLIERRAKSKMQQSSKLKEKTKAGKYKLKRETSDEESQERWERESETSSAESGRNNKDSEGECFYDDYLDTPDKQLKRTSLSIEKLKIPLLSARYELEKPLKRFKSKVRETYKQEKRKKNPSKKASTSKSKSNEEEDGPRRRRARMSKKDRKKTVEKEPSPKKVGIYTQNLYRGCDVYFELDGIEIEPEIEDYHRYANEIKPSELYIDLELECEENPPIQTQTLDVAGGADDLQIELEVVEEEQSQRIRKGCYTLDEDLKIIEYIQTHDEVYLQPTSKKYWEKAIEKFNLLEGTRSADSLRERYRLYLGDLDENDKIVIDSWLSEHGREGYLTFKKKEVADITGQKYIRNALDTIVLRHHPSTPSVPAKKDKNKLTKFSDAKTRTKLEWQFENSFDGSENEIVYKPREMVQAPAEVIENTTRNSFPKSPLPANSNMEVEDPSKNKQPPPKPSNQREIQLRIASPNHLIGNRGKPIIRDRGVEANHEDDEIESVEDKIIPSMSLSDDISTQKTSQRFSQPVAPSSLVQNDHAYKPDSHIEDDIEEEEKKIVEEVVYYPQEKLSSLKKPYKPPESMNLLSRYFTPSKDRKPEEEERELLGSKPRKQVKKPEDHDSNKENANINQISKDSLRMQPEINPKDMQKVVEKADWVKRISQKYNKTPKELLEIFYYCSMNVKILEKYFAGEDYLLWIKEEDDILLEGRDRVIRMLQKYKKPENVLMRQEFLKNYQHLKQAATTDRLMVN